MAELGCGSQQQTNAKIDSHVFWWNDSVTVSHALRGVLESECDGKGISIWSVIIFLSWNNETPTKCPLIRFISFARRVSNWHRLFLRVKINWCRWCICHKNLWMTACDAVGLLDGDNGSLHSYHPMQSHKFLLLITSLSIVFDIIFGLFFFGRARISSWYVSNA